MIEDDLSILANLPGFERLTLQRVVGQYQGEPIPIYLLQLVRNNQMQIASAASEEGLDQFRLRQLVNDLLKVV